MSAVTSPTQTLREEHRVILRALALLEIAAARLSGARDAPARPGEERSRELALERQVE